MVKPKPEPLAIRSAEEQVYVALREQIVHGLPPLSPLGLEEIAASLQVSTMPVRGALRRLEAENLVVTRPRRGSFVAPVRVQDIEEIQTMRCRVEGLAARIGTPHVDAAGLASMRKHLTAIKRAVAKKDIDAYVVHLRAFEGVCFDAAGWPRLLKLVDELWRSAERYLRIAVAGGSDAVLTSTFWDRFYEAVETRDPDKAEEAIVEAVTWTLDWMRSHLTSQIQSPLAEVVPEGTKET